MKDKLEKYMKFGDSNHYTNILNIMLNNRSKDWFSELGKYVDDTIDISEIPGLSFYLSRKPSESKFKNIKDFGLFTNVDKKYDSDMKNYYSGLSTMFTTAVLDDVSLRKMFGESILHSEFGEGFDGDWDEELQEYKDSDITESCASYFITSGGVDFHISYDHRGTKIEIDLGKSYDSRPTDDMAERCLGGLKSLVDLFKEKCL